MVCLFIWWIMWAYFYMLSHPCISLGWSRLDNAGWCFWCVLDLIWQYFGCTKNNCWYFSERAKKISHDSTWLRGNRKCMQTNKSLFPPAYHKIRHHSRSEYHVFFFLSLQCALVRVNGLPMEVVARYRGNRTCFCLMSTHCYEIRHFSGSSLRQKGKNHLCKMS